VPDCQEGPGLRAGVGIGRCSAASSQRRRRQRSPSSHWARTFELRAAPHGSQRMCIAANRHRGSGHPLAPATPPDMRVRIGRFRGLGQAIEESRKTERVKVADGKRVRQGGTLRQMPGAVGTARRLRGEILADS